MAKSKEDIELEQLREAVKQIWEISNEYIRHLLPESAYADPKPGKPASDAKLDLMDDFLSKLVGSNYNKEIKSEGNKAERDSLFISVLSQTDLTTIKTNLKAAKDHLESKDQNGRVISDRLSERRGNDDGFKGLIKNILNILNKVTLGLVAKTTGQKTVGAIHGVFKDQQKREKGTEAPAPKPEGPGGNK